MKPKCIKHDVELIKYPTPEISGEKGYYCPECEKERIWNQTPQMEK